MTTTPGVNVPHGARPTHLTFFRYGEATLLFERVRSTSNDELDLAEVSRTVDNVLKESGTRLSEKYPHLQRGGKQERTVLPIEYKGRSPLRFLTVNLEHWEPDLEQLNDRDGHHPRLDDSIRDVPKAVDALNTHARRISVGDWQLVAASPNWTAVPFCYWDGGGPGGRPVPSSDPVNLSRFRPDGSPKHVRDAVVHCLNGQGAISDDVRGATRVAILDTWPMDQEPDIPCGGVPAHPLGKIRQFLQQHPDARANDVLQAAARGHLVHPSRIFDYVSCQPPSTIPATHINWASREFEFGYDVSDHGLFIAGMIKEIAPDADISLYRVLHDDGSGDLDVIVQALQHAIADAKGEPLVINMSLGFAPALLMVCELLRPGPAGNSQNAVDIQNAQRWAAAMADRAHADDQYEADPLLDARTLEACGLVRLNRARSKVEGLGGSLALVDYFFRLPTEEKVFVVAAAGNDSAGNKHRFGPRLPAAVEGVLGVSARGADFSNRDDIENERDDGVSAFGGLAANDPMTGAMTTTRGLVGAAVTPNLSPAIPHSSSSTAQPNTNGWSVWAGTSFAAPIASGLAACVWAERPNLTTTELMEALVGTPGAGKKEIHLEQQPIGV